MSLAVFLIVNGVAFGTFFFFSFQCFRLSNPVWGISGRELTSRKWNVKRSLPRGQDERKTCLAEGTAWAEALRHGRMRCTWGTEGDVAGSLSIDGKLQRKERWKSAGDRHGRSGAIVRGSDFILQATGRVFRRDVICSIQLLDASLQEAQRSLGL